MSDHFTYLSPLISDPNTQKITLAVGLAILMVAIGRTLTARLSDDSALESHVVPNRKITLFGFFDAFVELFLAHHDSILGKKNRKYMPFTASLFLFLLAANLLGLVPGMPAITTTVWVNVGMALVVFLYFNYLGIKEHGLLSYLKHFCGPVWLLAWFIFPLEIFSTCLRVLTLNLRLYWNINADHEVLNIFTNLIGPFAAPFYVMGVFVCFMQAFIFTTLTMVYILLATQHEEGH